MEYKKIGAFIREKRRAAGLTQEALAARLGVSAKAVSKWENAVCLPDASLYEPLCRQLGITIGQLFQGGGEDPGNKAENDGGKEDVEDGGVGGKRTEKKRDCGA